LSVIAVRLNIVPGQVGYELLVSVLLFVKNQEFLESLIWVAEPSCTYKYAQLTWHVEPWEGSALVKLGPRDVIDRVSALGDNV